MSFWPGRTGLFIILISLMTPVLTCGQSTPEKLRVGIYDNPPKIYTDESGQPAGFFVDLISHMGEKLNFEPEYVEVTWAMGLKALDDGRIDIMPDVTLTPERVRKYHFNDVSILENWASLYIHDEAEPTYYTLQDIRGKSVAVMMEDGNFEFLKQTLGADSALVRYVKCRTYTEVFEAVHSRRSDMGLVSYYFGVHRDDDFDVKQLPLVVNPNTVHLVAKKGGHNRLLNLIDQELISLKNDEESLFYNLVDRWLATDNYFRFPRWLSWLLAAMVIALFLLLVTILILQVRLQRGKEDLTRINEELTRHIENKVRIEENLRNRNRELAKTNEAMDQLIYQVSHNLRAPIASVLGLINLIRMEIPDEEITGRPISKMEKSMQRLDIIISDILDYYRNSRTHVAREEIDFHEMINDIFQSLLHMNPSERVELRTDIVRNTALYSDQRRLKSIMHNLISNALKYYDPEKSDHYILISAHINDDRADISVEDNGLGIPEDQHGKVFTMFYRATTQGNGAGLGLYIIKETLEKLDGKIELSSKTGTGTTFRLVIPNLHYETPLESNLST